MSAKEVRPGRFEDLGDRIKDMLQKGLPWGKQAVDALCNSEELLKLIIDNMSDMVRLTDLQGNNLYASPSHFTGLGYKPEELVGKSTFDFVHPADIENVFKVFSEGVAKTQLATVECRAKHANGHYVWLETVGDFFKDDNGDVIAIVMVSRDITEHKKTEEMLLESEKRYGVLFEGSIHGILAVDLETGRFNYANPSICRMFGYSETEFLLLGIEDIHPADSLDHVKTAFELQKRGEKALASGLPCLRKDGTVFYADITAAATVINGRECVVGFFANVTDRKEIEAGLEKIRKELAATKICEDEAREYAESIINTVREPLIVLNQDLRVVTASRSFYKFFKVTREETEGQLIYNLGNKQWDIPKLRDLLETILPEKATFENYEVEHDFATIGRRIMLLNARQIQRLLGKARIILLAIEDITERRMSEENVRALNKELQERLQELTEARFFEEKANRAKAEFLSNISHEFTTPLNHIIGFSQVLLGMNYGSLNEKQRKYLNTILNSGERLHETLKNIVSFISMNVSNPDMDWEEFRLKDIVSLSLSVFRKEAADRHLTLTLDMAEEADRIIRADRGKLIQVFHNLLSNAVKFSGEGGQITLCVRYRKGSEGSGKDDFMEVKVEDTGIGIKEEDLPRLFRSFEQLEASLTKQFAGVGMGLVLARKLIDAHGGTIRMESEYGKGSRVIFTIPVSQTEGE